MPAEDSARLPALHQPFLRVLADRLQHAVARWAVLVDDDQRAGGQGVEGVEQVGTLKHVVRAHRLRRLQRPAAGEGA
ncbi:MAG: hypothetical protein C4345_01855 [Chloroflexota bacterium]